MSKIPYIPLRMRSAYSLLEGAMTVPTITAMTKARAIPAVALTDNQNMFGSLEFSQSCTKQGIQPIIGVQCAYLAHHPASNTSVDVETDQLILLAADEEGYHNLLKLVTLAYMEPDSKDGQPFLQFDKVAAHAQGVIALSGGVYGGIGKACLRGNHAQARELAETMQACFADRFYMEIMRHGLEEERRSEPAMLELAKACNIPLVATNDIYFDTREKYGAHDALICIKEGRYVTEDDRRRLTPEHYYKDDREMRALFADLPEAIDNTAVIAQRCTAFSPARAPILPSFRIEENGTVLSEADALRKLAGAGLAQRLRDHVYHDGMSEAEREDAAKPYLTRLDYELDVIISMGFPGYFLIVSDFITWSKEQGIPVGPGRGSGAASVVAWSLLITDLNPLEFDLVFERFLNPERVSMPDFDIDFCQERRDEVIRYVQQKYGADKVAQIITFGKLQARAVLRDVGRVLQMPYGQVDKICKLVPANPANPVTLEEAIEIEPLLKAQMQEEEAVAQLVDISLKLEGLYRHSSTHAAGVVIGDRPLDALVPVYCDARSDMPVVQYSMKYAEMAGLVKFDFLGLKTLTVLAEAVRLVGLRGETIDLARLPMDDQPTFDLLRAGETVGVFQLESAGMRDSLRKLQPDRLEDLIAMVSLYRPGPMDNIPTYIARKHGKEAPDYLHPSLKPVLEETYGVIIYQEQVQKIAQILSGYTLGGADLLRRAMGKKIKAEMDAQRITFVEGAEKNNISAKQANDIFDLVAKFAGYGFNKAHAAAYALIGYQTAYLKANYPVEFMAASMTYDAQNTDKLSLFKQDVEAMGYAVLPPDINASQVRFSVEMHEDKRAVRYALCALKNVGEQAMADLVKEREAGGAFRDIFDVVCRVSAKVLNRRQFEHLIMAGVFDSLHPNRRQLFDHLDVLLAYGQGVAEEKASSQNSLFGEATDSIQQPRLREVEEWPALERLEREFKAIGFYLTAHPLEGYGSALEMLRIKPLVAISERLGGEYTKVKLAGIVMGKKIKTSPKGRFAFVQLSDTSAVYEASIFDENLLDTNRDLLETGTIVSISGEAKMGDAGPRIIIQSMKKLDDALKAGGRRGGELRVHLPNIDAVAELQRVLGRADNAGQQVTCYVPCATDHDAVIRLAARYDITPEDMLNLQQMQHLRVL